MVRKILVAAGLAALLVVVTHLVLKWWADSRLGALEERWREEIFGGATASEAYPTRAKSSGAAEVERLAAELGIVFEAPGTPDADALGRPSALGGEPGSAAEAYLLARAASDTDELATFPPAVRERLAEREAQLGDLVATLLDSDVHWPLEVELALEMPVMDHTAHLELHELLIVAAWEALERGDGLSADRRLHAAWRLRESVAADPLLIIAMVNLSELQRELALMRRLCPAPAAAGWTERLAGLDPAAAYRHALRTEAWAVVRSATRPEALAGVSKPAAPFARSLGRAAIVAYGETADEAARDLADEAWSTFQPEDFFAERRDRIPRWNVFSRIVFLDVYDAWDAAGRAQLAAELTERVLAARVAGEAPESPVVSASGLDPALEWRTTGVADAAVEIELVGSMGRSLGSLPAVVRSRESGRLAVRHVVDLGHCAGGASGSWR